MSSWANLSANWDDRTNWVGGVPNGNTSVASFTNVAGAAGRRTIDLGGGTFTVRQLDMVASSTVAYALTNGILTMAASSGSAAININATTASTPNSNLNTTLTLNLASNTNFDIGVNAALAVSAITGTGSLNKSGTGKLLMFEANSAWTGATTIDAGVLTLTSSNALASSSALTINSGGTLELAASGGGTFNVNALSGAGFVRGGTAGLQTLDIKSGGGLFSGAITDGTGTVALRHDTSGVTYLTGTGNTYTGGTTVNAGLLVFGDGANPSASVGTGTVTINGGVFALFRPGNFTFTNALAGAGRFDKNSVGTATLTGNNSAFTGQILVNGGTLKASDANSLGTKAPITVAAGATLDVSALNAVTIGALSGAGTVASKNFQDITIDTGAGSATFSGAFASFPSIHKTGTGSLTISSSVDQLNKVYLESPIRKLLSNTSIL